MLILQGKDVHLLESSIDNWKSGSIFISSFYNKNKIYICVWSQSCAYKLNIYLHHEKKKDMVTASYIKGCRDDTCEWWTINGGMEPRRSHGNVVKVVPMRMSTWIYIGRRYQRIMHGWWRVWTEKLKQLNANKLKQRNKTAWLSSSHTWHISSLHLFWSVI